MVPKRFYQMAASEVATGAIDQALWVKVTATHPNESDLDRQARYIRLRAVELSAKHGTMAVYRIVPRKWWHWIVCIVVTFIIGDIVNVIVDDNTGSTILTVWSLLMLAVMVLAIVRYIAGRTRQ